MDTADRIQGYRCRLGNRLFLLCLTRGGGAIGSRIRGVAVEEQRRRIKYETQQKGRNYLSLTEERKRGGSPWHRTAKCVKQAERAYEDLVRSGGSHGLGSARIAADWPRRCPGVPPCHIKSPIRNDSPDAHGRRHGERDGVLPVCCHLAAIPSCWWCVCTAVRSRTAQAAARSTCGRPLR